MPRDEQATKLAAFHVFTPTGTLQVKLKTILRQEALPIGLGLAGVVVLFGALHRATPEILLILSCNLLLLVLLISERQRQGRRAREMAEQLQQMGDYHDRLVREVARSRGDLVALKEGLSDTAASFELREKGAESDRTPETRMIEAIVAQLGALGEKPRTSLERQAPVNQILELEIKPPPLRPPQLAQDDPSDFGGKLDPETLLQMIRYAVRNDTIDVFLQPVVSLPQRKTRLFEIFARLRAGNDVYVPAAYYLEVAQQEKLGPAIDNLLLLRCLQLLRGATNDDSGEAPYMLNITAATLNDRGFMGDLVAFLSQYRPMAARLIFEFTQKEFDSMGDAAQPLLDGLARLGCRFSMDGVRRGALDIAMLKSRHVRFIKLDAAWLIREGASEAGSARVVRLKQQLDAAGIDLIVEKIESENSLRTLLDYQIDFGQGYLFARPQIASFVAPATRQSA